MSKQRLAPWRSAGHLNSNNKEENYISFFPFMFRKHLVSCNFIFEKKYLIS